MFRDTSVSALRHLTVDQALADLAQFISYVKSDHFENGRYKNGSVALVGCSYSGSMVTWMRLAYPHLVNVAFSDSGPLRAQENFSEYFDIVAETLRSQGGEACLGAIRTAMETLTDMLNNTESGPAQISEMFNTCSLIQASSLDLATFFLFGVTDPFAELVQYAHPGDIARACQRLVNTTLGNPVQRLADFVKSYHQESCLETRYTQLVTQYTNTSFENPHTTMRLWTYQMCVQFGWFQTVSSQHLPFLDTVPLEFFHQMCRDFYGYYFNEELIRSGISRTNLLFSGSSRLPDGVVSVVGAADPWRGLAPTAAHATPLSPVYVVPQASHCRAVGSTGDTEIRELEKAKEAVLEFMSRAEPGARPPPASQGAHTHLASLGALCGLLAVAMFI